MSKRLIALLSSILLIFNLMPAGMVSAEGDITAPVLESISVDKKVAVEGDSVKVSIKATDDVGISYVSVTYKKPITGNTFITSLRYNSTTDAYEGLLPITSTSESGTYHISYLSIYDTSDNKISLSSSGDLNQQLPAGDFTVTGTNGDVTAPTLESITVDKKEATIGDSVKVSVKAKDDQGISYVSVTYKKPITGNTFITSLRYNSTTDAYEGLVPITSTSESGTYHISYLSIYDTSDNKISLSSSSDINQQLPAGDFAVTGTNGDVTKPTLESISVDKDKATYGDTVKVSLKATDNVGISYVSVTYKKPITGNTFITTLRYNTTTGAYEAMLPITSTSESGIYKISYLSIYDTSDNKLSISPSSDLNQQLPGGDFRVYTEQNLPTVTSFSIDKGKVEAGDSLTFTVEAKDDSNLESGKVHLISPISQSEVFVPLTFDGSHFIGKLSIQQNTEVGKWIVDSFEIQDTNGNIRSVDLTVGEFTVLSPVAPLDSYVVTTNESWSNKNINSDVYIAPGAVLTVNNVTVNGNIYVLGGLKSYGGLIMHGNLYGNFMTFGYYYPSDGQIILSGSNSVSSITISNRILTIVPLRVDDRPLVSKDGKISLTGATLPFVRATMNGQAIPLKSTGTFRVEDFNVSDKLEMVLTDPYGYQYTYSYPVAEIFVDELTMKSTEATGKTHANSTVKILSSGNQIASGQTDKNGHFAIPVSNLTENSTVKFEVYDAKNMLTTSKEIVVKDMTAPEKPVVDEVSDLSTVITGEAEAGSMVYVKQGSSILVQGKATEAGEFSLDLPKQAAGTLLTVFAKDASGNQSEAAAVTVSDKTAPEKPVVNEVSDITTVITGKAEAGATVYAVTGNTILAKAVANQDGEFNVVMTKQQIAGTEISVYVEDTARNKSEEVLVTVLDKTAPEKPVVDEVSDLTTAMTGKVEPNSTVYVKTGTDILVQGKANETGEFSLTIIKQKAETKLTVYAEDTAGNESEETTVTVLDKTAPEKPSVNEVTSLEQFLSGTAEPNATITVKNREVVLGTAIADSTGKFSVLIGQQKAGTSLSVTAKDKAENLSGAVVVSVTNSFVDVAVEQRFHEEIRYLADENIITGFPDGTFRPFATVTRAQAAIMIGRALGLDGTQRNTDFGDVSDSQKASGFIASAVEKGIITGFPDNTYRPDEPVTRGQMAIFIARAFELKEESDTSFTDVNPNSAAAVYIKRILADSITTGYPDGTFKPSRQLIRSDFSAFMARAVDDKFKVQ